MNWFVYIIRCSDESLYTGITTQIKRRFNQHATQQGAKYFRGRKPIEVIYVEIKANRSAASQREAAIKKLKRSEKLLLLSAEINTVSDFFNKPL